MGNYRGDTRQYGPAIIREEADTAVARDRAGVGSLVAHADLSRV